MQNCFLVNFVVMRKEKVCFQKENKRVTQLQERKRERERERERRGEREKERERGERKKERKRERGERERETNSENVFLQYFLEVIIAINLK